MSGMIFILFPVRQASRARLFSFDDVKVEKKDFWTAFEPFVVPVKAARRKT